MRPRLLVAMDHRSPSTSRLRQDNSSTYLRGRDNIRRSRSTAPRNRSTVDRSTVDRSNSMAHRSSSMVDRSSSTVGRRGSATTIPSNSMLVQMGPSKWKARMGREGLWAQLRVAAQAGT